MSRVLALKGESECPAITEFRLILTTNGSGNPNASAQPHGLSFGSLTLRPFSLQRWKFGYTQICTAVRNQR